MSDLFGSIDPDRLFLAAAMVLAACSILFGCAMALSIWALRGLKKQAHDEFQDPDPFFRPGSHNGLRVGPIPARTQETGKLASEMSRPGPSQ